MTEIPRYRPSVGVLAQLGYLRSLLAAGAPVPPPPIPMAEPSLIDTSQADTAAAQALQAFVNQIAPLVGDPYFQDTLTRYGFRGRSYNQPPVPFDPDPFD